MVGRENELQAVEAFIEEVASGTAMVLGGEPGIGKTTMWEAGVAKARQQGDLILEARGSQAETQHSFAALIDLLDGFDLEDLDDIPVPQLRALEIALLREGTDDAEADPHATALGMLAAIRKLSATRRVLIAIDDVQWIDSSSAEALAYVVRRIKDEPVRILVGMRTGESSPMVDAVHVEGILRLDLEPLDEVDIRHVVLDHLGLTFPRRVIQSIHESSLGNPYLALELARVLAERDPLRIGEYIPIPERAWDLPGSRVEALPDNQRDLLLAVSLSCDISVEQLNEMGRSEALEDALDAGLVEIRRGRVSPSHPLLAAASRAAAESRECRALHRELARVATEDETCALHLGLATNVPDEELAADLCRASIHASARGARQSAVELAEHALRLTPMESPTRVEHLNVLAEALFVAGEACRMNELLIPEIDRLPAGGVRGNALLLMCRALLMSGEGGDRNGGEAPVVLLDQALAESRGDPKVRAIALARKAEYCLKVSVEDVPGAMELALEAADVAATADAEARRLSFYALAWARAMSGDSIDCLREEFFFNVAGGYHLVDSVERVAAMQSLWRGAIDGARGLLDEMLLQADARGEGASYSTLRLHLCDLELRAGNWEEAGILLEEAEQFEGTAQPLASSKSRYRALLAAGLGDVDEAKEWAETAIQEALGEGSRWEELDGLRALGAAMLLDNDPASAAESLGTVWSHTMDNGIRDPAAFPVANDLIESLVEIGEIEEATDVIGHLNEIAETTDHPWARLSAARGRAVLNLRKATDDEAAATLRDTARSFGQLGFRFEEARTLLTLGRNLRRQKQWGGARSALEEASAILEELGSVGWAARTKAELDRVAARPPRATGELTPSERSTAELAAQGLKNKEIAERQFITVNTVEAHLTRTYAKLGIRSRAQLTQKLAEVL